MYARAAVIRPSTLATYRALSASRFPVFLSKGEPQLQSHRLTYSIRAMATNGAPALERKQVEQEANHLGNGDVKVNNWSQPGPAAFDFRSMYRRAPMKQCTLFEAHEAEFVVM